MPNKKRKTVGRSFRIDEEWLDVLKEESEKQGVSVNSILNRLLQQYAYLRYMLRYGAITLTLKVSLQYWIPAQRIKYEKTGERWVQRLLKIFC